MPQASTPGTVSVNQGKNVASRVQEPGDVGTGVVVPAAHDALRVDPRDVLVAFNGHASGGEVIDGCVDVLYFEIQDGGARRLVVRLRVDEGRATAGQLDPRADAVRLHGQPQSCRVELLRGPQVVHRESA